MNPKPQTVPYPLWFSLFTNIYNINKEWKMRRVNHKQSTKEFYQRKTNRNETQMILPLLLSLSFLLLLCPSFSASVLCFYVCRLLFVSRLNSVELRVEIFGEGCVSHHNSKDVLPSFAGINICIYRRLIRVGCDWWKDLDQIKIDNWNSVKKNDSPNFIEWMCEGNRNHMSRYFQEVYLVLSVISDFYWCNLKGVCFLLIRLCILFTGCNLLNNSYWICKLYPF